MISSNFKIALMINISLITGCASLLGNSQYPVNIISAPVTSTFEITDKSGKLIHTGNTPSTITLKSGRGYFKGETYTFKFHSPGYADKIVTLDSSLSRWYWGNILFGGIVGMLIVDPATGAMYKLPESVSADLGKPITQAEKGDDIIIKTVDQVPVNLRYALVRIQ
jgi:hypothetical protein